MVKFELNLYGWWESNPLDTLIPNQGDNLYLSSIYYVVVPLGYDPNSSAFQTDVVTTSTKEPLHIFHIIVVLTYPAIKISK